MKFKLLVFSCCLPHAEMDIVEITMDTMTGI